MDNTDTKSSSIPPIGQAIQPSGNAVGLAQKEQAPPVNSKVVPEVSEIIAKSGEGPEIDEEVRRAGIEPVSEKPNLTEEHAKIGIQHAGESVPVRTQPSVSHPYPISEIEARENLKTKGDDESVKWESKTIVREIDKERISNIK